MSAYSSAAQWGGACKGANQSPINLSQSFAKPCDILCDLVFDEGYVSSGVVEVTSEGLVLYSQTGLGTCKYNGTGYTCNALLVNHPSHHAIENIQADAEVLALFTNPTGKKLVVSSLVRVNPAQTNASKFLNGFIPYASTRPTHIKFGDDWTLSMMVPPKATYYSYAGSLPLGGCEPAQVIVFGAMINIDSNDFALLVKNVPAGSRPVQSLGDRDVFFNSGEQLPGGQMPKDGKIYMRLRPKKDDGKKKDRNINQPDIAGPQKREQDKSGFFGYISQWARDQTEINGIFSLINAILLFVAFGLAVYCAYKYSEKLKILLYLNDKSIETALWLRQKIVGGVANYKAAKLASATTKSSSSSKPVGQLLPSASAAEIAKKADEPIEKALEPVSKAAEPVTQIVDKPAEAVLSNPVAEAVSDATEASEKKKGLKRVDSGLLPDISGKSNLDRGQASTRAMGFGTTGVNVDNLLNTAPSSKSSSDESKPFESHLGTKKAHAPVRIRRNSVNG